MVKSVAYALAAIAACIVLFVCADIFIDRQFSSFADSVEALYYKVEDKTAGREDGFAVRTLWEDRKSKLQIFLPHNDISYVDYWLNEACGLIYVGEYDLALAKLEVLKAISRNLPEAYSLKLENIL